MSTHFDDNKKRTIWGKRSSPSLHGAVPSLSTPLPSAQLVQRAQTDPQSLGTGDIAYLQRTMGNRSVASLMGRSPQPIQPQVTQPQVTQPQLLQRTSEPIIQRFGDTGNQISYRDKKLLEHAILAMGKEFNIPKKERRMAAANILRSSMQYAREMIGSIGNTPHGTAFLNYVDSVNAVISLASETAQYALMQNDDSQMWSQLKGMNRAVRQAKDNEPEGRFQKWWNQKRMNIKVKKGGSRVLPKVRKQIESTFPFQILKQDYEALVALLGKSMLVPISPRAILSTTSGIVLSEMLALKRVEARTDPSVLEMYKEQNLSTQEPLNQKQESPEFDSDESDLEEEIDLRDQL